MKKFLKKFIVVLMALLMISSVVSESAETVYAHKRGHSITRVHKTRRKASGRSRRASHPRRKVVRRKVKKRKAPKRHKKVVRRKAPRKTATRRKAPKKHKKSARKKAPKKKTPWWKKAVNGAKKLVKKATKKVKKFVKKHKSAFVTAGDLLGVNDIYTLATGKDIGTGKRASRWVAAAWIATSFIPVGRIAGKAGKLFLKGGKAAKRVIKASKGAKRVSKIFKRFGKGAKKIKPKWFKKAGKKAAPKGVGNSVKTLGRGSTGRTTANNLTEQLAMKEVKSNPLKGAESLNKIKMNDKRWPANKGWVKMQRVVIKKGKKIVIHFVYNTKTRKIDDFKFK